MRASRNLAELSDFTPPSGEYASWLVAQERRLVSCLALGIIHDFNNALSTLQTNTFLLREGCAEDREELIQELDHSIDEGVELTQQMRALILEPLTGPAARSVADLLSTGEQLLQRLGDPTLRTLCETPAGADDAWLEALVSELLVSTLLGLLVGALPPNNGAIKVACRLETQAEVVTPAGRASAGQARLTLCATHPTFSDQPAQALPRRAWLAKSAVARLAGTLATRLGSNLALATAAPDRLEFRLDLPLLSAEEARVAKGRSSYSEGAASVDG